MRQERLDPSPGTAHETQDEFLWDGDAPEWVNYEALGEALRLSSDLFRRPSGGGLLRLILPEVLECEDLPED